MVPPPSGSPGTGGSEREAPQGSATPSPASLFPESQGPRLGGHPQVSLYLCWGRAEPLPSIPAGRRRMSSTAAGLPFGSAPSRYGPTALQGHAGLRPLQLITPPATPSRSCVPLCHPQPALTALGVKPPGWHTGGHHGRGIGGQRDRQVDGAGQRHLGPVAGEQVDADSRHRCQLQPGAIGCRDKDGDIPKGGPHGVCRPPPSPRCPPYRCRPARPRGRRGRRGPGWGRRRR